MSALAGHRPRSSPRIRLALLLAVQLLCWPAAVAAVAASEQEAPSGKVLEESWEAIYIGGKKAGYVHTVAVARKLDDGREVIEVRTKSFMRLRRFGQPIEMEVHTRSVELAETGDLLETELVTRSGQIEAMRVKARVEDNELAISIATLGKETTQRIPWKPMPGPYAIDKRIGNVAKLAKGETVQFRFFDGSFQAVVTGKLTAAGHEEVQLLDRTAKLRRVRFDLFLSGRDQPLLTTHVWVDEQGEALKSRIAMLGGMETYKVSKEVALAEPEELSEDVALRSLVPIRGRLDRPFETVRAVYRLHLEESVDPADVPLDDGPTQDVTIRPDGTILLTVYAEPQGDAEPEPGPQYRQPNSYLQSDNPKIRQIAEQAVGDADDPLEKARRMERWVFENLTNKNFGVAFASAAAVAESMEGDCTEHAVLLAAMARAQGLPARVAVGFVYAPSVGKFGGHMWTEIFINGHWRGFDATLGRGKLDAVHIKLGDSALGGIDAMVSLLPVVRAIEMIREIEVVELEYAQ